MRGVTRGMGVASFAAGTALIGVLRAWRARVMPRRDPRVPWSEFEVRAADGVRIAARWMPGEGDRALIIAHPAVTGQRYAPLVDFAEAAASRFDVFTFDFRGHGRSGGRLEMNLCGPLEDVRAVVREVRGRGYGWVGAVGFSLGGMAAFLCAAKHGGLDAVVTVGMPPGLPDIGPYRPILPLWSLFLLFLGARFRAVNEGGPVPMEAAAGFPDLPLLVVHGENEAFYRRSDLDSMLAKMDGKAELMVIDGAGHTELAGREKELLDWLMEKSRGRG